MSLLLAVETCFDACGVAVFDGTRLIAEREEAMTRGHSEALAPMLAAALADCGAAPQDLARIAVDVGPGGFTGQRVGAAFARGLALATGARCDGVCALDALVAAADAPGAVLALIDAKRGQVYAGGDGAAPRALSIERFSPPPGVRLIGSGAALVSQTAEPPIFPRARHVGAAALAGAICAPSPIYLREADAALPTLGAHGLPA